MSRGVGQSPDSWDVTTPDVSNKLQSKECIKPVVIITIRCKTYKSWVTCHKAPYVKLFVPRSGSKLPREHSRDLDDGKSFVKVREKFRVST